MIKKYVNFILFLMYCSLNYFFYVKKDSFSLLSVIDDKNKLFFILIIFTNILLITFYLLFVQIKKRKILTNRIKKYNSHLRKYKNNYKNRLNKLRIESSVENKISFEQSKQRALNNLISNIAHHWRQPLSVITLLATSIQFYEEKNINLKNIIKDCELINKNAQYLSNIIDYFRELERSKIYRKKELFRLDIVLNKFLVNSAFSGIEIKINMLDNYFLYSYKDELFKVLFNIINNSKEKLNKRPLKDKKIFILVTLKKKELIIKIKDNAGGIDENIFDNIFEPYVTTKFKAKNVGLGLYLTYMIITQRLDGTIDVKNINFTDEQTNQQYKGALFTIKLPSTTVL